MALLRAQSNVGAICKGRLGLVTLLTLTCVIILIIGVQNTRLFRLTSNLESCDPGVSPLPLRGNVSFQLAHDQSLGFFDDIPDVYWRMAQERARTRKNHYYPHHTVDIGPNVVPASWYFKNYEPDFTCAQERRVGGLGDGPKWVCDPHRLKSKKDCLIYSVGSNGQYEFEMGMHEIAGGACEIHVFDPGSFERFNMTQEFNAYYHQWGFKSSYNNHTPQVGENNYMSLPETMKVLGHEGRTIDIFKVDCEGCEWSSYKDWLEADTRQILVETHLYNWMMDDFFRAFQDANFYLFRKEANIHPSSQGNNVEWAYVRLHPTFWNGTESE